MRTIVIIFIALVLSLTSKGQPKNRADCNFVDSFFLNAEQTDKIYVGFEKPKNNTSIEESVIMRARGGTEYYYYQVLACYPCSGRGMHGGSYGGYVKNKSVIGFIQRFSGWRDTVYIDFSTEPPIYNKYVHTSEIDPNDQYSDYPKIKIPISEYSIYNGGNEKYENEFRTVYMSVPKKKSRKK